MQNGTKNFILGFGVQRHGLLCVSVPRWQNRVGNIRFDPGQAFWYGLSVNRNLNLNLLLLLCRTAVGF